jgi:hypothetical protein
MKTALACENQENHENFQTLCMSEGQMLGGAIFYFDVLFVLPLLLASGLVFFFMRKKTKGVIFQNLFVIIAIAFVLLLMLAFLLPIILD